MARTRRAFRVSNSCDQQVERAHDIVPNMRDIADPRTETTDRGDADQMRHDPIFPLGVDEGRGEAFWSHSGPVGRKARCKDPRFDGFESVTLQNDDEALVWRKIKIEWRGHQSAVIRISLLGMPFSAIHSL